MHHCQSRQERGKAKSLAKYPFDQRIWSESRELREQQEEEGRVMVAVAKGIGVVVVLLI